MVEVVIPTRDNPDSLCMTLMGLRGQDVGRVAIGDNGTVPLVGHKNLGFVVAILEYEGIEVEIHRWGRAIGDADMRLRLLDLCDEEGEILWMDDDIMVQPGAIGKMADAYFAKWGNVSFVCGATVDPVNNRGFADFSVEPRPVTPNPLMHFAYKEDFIEQVNRAPGGFVLWNIEILRQVFKEEYREQFSRGVAGIDLLLSSEAVKIKPGYFRTGALSWHCFRGTQSWHPGPMMDAYVKEIRRK